ncbi:hypothetical protein RF11_14105 [Thelohanellus kitauei]|uniref:Tc1-like transposase DDE domain-containing protein n=1 Tax=Thelohanellus kitauei TaxID=669202 RepID=A0A0C2MJ71_THEKT|nr:hypothetical protein RF11_14105 [Thelohanellus kitauei]
MPPSALSLMGILSKTLCGIVWSYLLFIYSSESTTTVIFVKPGESDKPLTPLVDQFDSIEVIQNPIRPNFSLFFAKNSHSPEKNAFYRYDPKKPAFELVTLKTSAELVKLSKVVPAGKKMLCISNEDHIAFYINEKLDVEHEQKLLSQHEYVPHPNHPDFIARRQDRDKPLSIKSNKSVSDLVDVGHRAFFKAQDRQFNEVHSCGYFMEAFEQFLSNGIHEFPQNQQVPVTLQENALGVIYLPPYSPFLNLIESLSSKWNNVVKTVPEIRNRPILSSGSIGLNLLTMMAITAIC